MIGIGNTFRCDDGVGLLVARRLREQGLDARELTGEPISLLDAWQGFQSVVVIDAVQVQSGGQAGAVHRIDAVADGIPVDLCSASSTHLFGLSEAVELARQLEQLPARVIVYGIEGVCFDSGSEISAEVQAAMEQVVTAVLDEVGR